MAASPSHYESLLAASLSRYESLLAATLSHYETLLVASLSHYETLLVASLYHYETLLAAALSHYETLLAASLSYYETLCFYDHQGSIRNGQRCSTAKGYLVPAENRTNLDIVGGAYTKKVLFDGKRAVGVQFDYQNDEYEVRVRREVIMSAGTTNTAQLLMLSGIGPKKHLEKFDIPVIADLPVGDNFQDHCGFPMPFVFDAKPLKEKLNDTDNIMKYINNRTGPLASPELVSAMAFLDGQVVSPEDFPDHELYFLEISKEIAKEQVGLKPLVYKGIFFPYEDDPIFVCVSHLLHPKSRGTVRLQSTDPYDPPLIDPNYFEDPADVAAIVKGMQTCRKIGLSKPMKKVGVRPFATIFPEFTNIFPDFLLDEYFTFVTRSVVVTLSHQVGTAKMGDPKDPTTVVDPQLRKNCTGADCVPPVRRRPNAVEYRESEPMVADLCSDSGELGLSGKSYRFNISVTEPFYALKEKLYWCRLRLTFSSRIIREEKIKRNRIPGIRTNGG
ncbi:L-sorbose 1-dehydrogenase [Araneus ventricosus]|uniref:L-sorbose 1-dehydrogenase n=1 Tax=Araneus ventricosus TaxID=182803 RepID=A0A4Y2M425_ARAVE|nr:L-sorbose 1-dehydrogenase [Araneus ventricosus]